MLLVLHIDICIVRCGRSATLAVFNLFLFSRDYIEKTNDTFEAEDKEKCLSVLSGLEDTGYRYLADLMHLPLKVLDSIL